MAGRFVNGALLWIISGSSLERPWIGWGDSVSNAASYTGAARAGIIENLLSTV